jgi:agmatinase
MGFFDNHGQTYRNITSDVGFNKEDLHGIQAAHKEATLSSTRHDEEIKRNLALGLEAADSIGDRTISTFSRGELPHYAGINTFMKMPYLEDVNKVGDYDVAVMGVPFDIVLAHKPFAAFPRYTKPTIMSLVLICVNN